MDALRPYHGSAHGVPGGKGAYRFPVIAPRTIDSEAWAKPYFVNGRQWAAGHKPEPFRGSFAKTGGSSRAGGCPERLPGDFGGGSPRVRRIGLE